MMNNGMPDAQPFLQTWISALFPSDGTYADMTSSQNAKAATAYLWIFVSCLIQLFVFFLMQGDIIWAMMDRYGFAGSLPERNRFGLTMAVCGGPIGAIISVVFFAIGTAIVQLVARLLGGQGSYEKLAYALGAIAAPSAIISVIITLIGAIPIFGFCFGIVVGLFVLFMLRNAFLLQIQAVKDINQFGWARALVSVLILFAVFSLVALAVVLSIWPHLEVTIP